MFSTIVFDFDGTLVDSNALKRQGFFDAVADDADGAALMSAVLAREPGDRRALMAAYLLERDGAQCPASPEAVERLVARYNSHVDAAVAAAPEMPGATALLEALARQGCRACLSSATPLANLKAIVEQRGWVHHFHAIYGHPARKADTLSQVMREYGVAASQIAVVGDGSDDRSSALALGCAFFPVGEGRGSELGEHIYRLNELQQLLLKPRQRHAA